MPCKWHKVLRYSHTGILQWQPWQKQTWLNSCFTELTVMEVIVKACFNVGKEVPSSIKCHLTYIMATLWAFVKW